MRMRKEMLVTVATPPLTGKALSSTLVLGALLQVFANPVHAGQIELFGSQTSGSVSAWGLVQFDTNPITGATTRVGSGGLMFDMDFGPDGVLYAPRGSSGLHTVDPITGQMTLVGGWGLTPSPNITALAFAPDGTLYAHDNGGTSTLLYTVDQSAGQLTPVGPIGDFAFGMDFGPDGTLFASTAGKLYTIDPVTGAQDLILGNPIQLFLGLDFGVDGILRGVAGVGFSNDELFEIDPALGLSMSIGPTNETFMNGLASIPEPGTLSLLVVGGLALLRRRTRPFAPRARFATGAEPS